MFRTIDAQVYEGKPSADRWNVTVHDLGHGQKEACIQRCIDWEHVGPLDPDSIAAQVLRGEREDPNAAEKAEANMKRSARRAKTRMRRLCKASGFDTMLTLTYKGNQLDLDLAKRHMKEFVRRVKRVIEGFGYVAAFERQGRGAWHVHMAIHRVQPSFIQAGVRVKSYDLLRRIWRSVSGEWGGTANVGNDRGLKRYSPGRLAAYLSKYMLKAFELGEKWSNRYSGSTSLGVPAPVRMQFTGAKLAELVGLVYDEVAVGMRDVFTYLSRFGDVFYISTEPDPGHRLRPSEI